MPLQFKLWQEVERKNLGVRRVDTVASDNAEAPLKTVGIQAGSTRRT